MPLNHVASSHSTASRASGQRMTWAAGTTAAPERQTLLLFDSELGRVRDNPGGVECSTRELCSPPDLVWNLSASYVTLPTLLHETRTPQTTLDQPNGTK